MDFHAAMETFAEAWVAANTPTAVNASEIPQVSPAEDIPSQIQMEQKIKKRSNTNSPGQGQTTAAASGVKSLPIHCVIEQTNGPLTFEPDNTATYNVELDTYAILPCTTLFSELLRTALIKLGYNANEAMNAKGAIQIKNWKPLSFETITEDNKSTVEDILGDLTQTAKLRIRLCSSTKLSSTDEIKGKLLQLLLTQSQGILMSSGCPIEKDLLTSLSKGDSFSNLPLEIRKSFDKWYQDLQKQHTEDTRHSNTSTPEKLPASPQREQQSYSTNHAPLHGKTRMRTSFDPEHEIPRLQKWFAENQHPPREVMIKYLEELNSLDSRKGRRPLDLTNIIYWFKNARAAHRRASKCFDGDTSFEGDEITDESTNTQENGCFMGTRGLPYMLPYPFQGIYGSHDILGDALKEPCDLSQAGQRARMNGMKKEEEAERTSKTEGEKLESKSADTDQEKSDDDDKDKEGHGVTIKKESSSSEGEKTPDIGETPYLPNRNAVYVLPHQYGQYKNSQDGDDEPREPCDLSNSHKSSQVKKDILDTANNNRKRKSSSDDEQEKENSNEKADSLNRYNTEKQRSSSQDYPNHSSRSSNGNSEVFHSGSDDDNDLESDMDDSQSYAGSESSHEAKDGAYIREAHLGSYNANALSRLQQQHSAAGLHHPLHIPHFPHPLAMTYFPMNSHFLQQTTRYQQQQNSQVMSSDDSPTEHHIKSSSLSSSHRKRRTRVFIDPMSEIPKLEKWFAEDTHPSSYMIDKYCEELNKSEYRQKFPKLEAKNVQLWFKNHRAKVKRMRVSSVDLHGMEYRMEKC